MSPTRPPKKKSLQVNKSLQLSPQQKQTRENKEKQALMHQMKIDQIQNASGLREIDLSRNRISDLFV